jgi:hypothetical protein
LVGKKNTINYGADEGVSGIKFPYGEKYIGLLFKTKQENTPISLATDSADKDKSAAVLFNSELLLSSIRWDEYLGVLVVIRTNSEY